MARTRIIAYAFGGVFAALAGLALTAYTSSGDPNSAANYTLNSIAAVVLGGVSLAGGRGGLAGPTAAAVVLSQVLIILDFLNVNPNYTQVIQGAVVVAVVLFAGLLRCVEGVDEHARHGVTAARHRRIVGRLGREPAPPHCRSADLRADRHPGAPLPLPRHRHPGYLSLHSVSSTLTLPPSSA